MVPSLLNLNHLTHVFIYIWHKSNKLGSLFENQKHKFIAKLSPKPQPKLEDELALIPIYPATH